MAAINARQARLFLNEFNLSTGLNEITSAAEQDELDVTTFEGSSGFREFITGFRGGTITLSGFYAFTTSTSSTDNNRTDAVFDGIFGATTLPVLTYAPDGSAVGNNALLLEGIETSYEVDSSIGDASAVAASLRNSDGPDYGDLLHTHSASTSTGGSASVQHNTTAGTAGGGVGHLHVTSFSTFTGSTETEQMIVKIQHSSDDATWADLITFSTVTGATVQRSTVSGTVKEFVRESRSNFQSDTATYVVSFARR